MRRVNPREGRLQVRQDVRRHSAGRHLRGGEPIRRRPRLHGRRRELHAGGPRLRAPSGNRDLREPFRERDRGRRPQDDVRVGLGQPCHGRGGHRAGGRPGRDALPREPARVHLFPDPVPPVPRLHGGRRGQRHPPRPQVRGVRGLEQALRLPEGRRRGRHPQAGEVQGLHHRRLGGPGQDLRGARRHEVLPGAQRPHPRAVPEAPAGQLDPVDAGQRRPQPAGRRPLQLHGAQPHRPVALPRHERRGGPRAPALGPLRPPRHRREPQLQEQEHRRGQDRPLHAPHRGRHQVGPAHEGAHALCHPGEQPPARPAKPDRAHHRGRRRVPRRYRWHPVDHPRDARRPAEVQRVEQALRLRAHDRELRERGERRLLQAARRADHRAQPQAHHEVLRRRERYLPGAPAAPVVSDAH